MSVIKNNNNDKRKSLTSYRECAFTRGTRHAVDLKCAGVVFGAVAVSGKCLCVPPGVKFKYLKTNNFYSTIIYWNKNVIYNIIITTAAVINSVSKRRACAISSFAPGANDIFGRCTVPRFGPRSAISATTTSDGEKSSLHASAEKQKKKKPVEFYRRSFQRVYWFSLVAATKRGAAVPSVEEKRPSCVRVHGKSYNNFTANFVNFPPTLNEAFSAAATSSHCHAHYTYFSRRVLLLIKRTVTYACAQSSSPRLAAKIRYRPRCRARTTNAANVQTYNALITRRSVLRDLSGAETPREVRRTSGILSIATFFLILR